MVHGDFYTGRDRSPGIQQHLGCFQMSRGAAEQKCSAATLVFCVNQLFVWLGFKQRRDAFWLCNSTVERRPLVVVHRFKQALPCQQLYSANLTFVHCMVEWSGIDEQVGGREGQKGK